MQRSNKKKSSTHANMIKKSCENRRSERVREEERRRKKMTRWEWATERKKKFPEEYKKKKHGPLVKFIWCMCTLDVLVEH